MTDNTAEYTQRDAKGWQKIETIPCDDSLVLVWGLHNGGCIEVLDADHDSDPHFWKSHGYTHWMPLPEPPK